MLKQLDKWHKTKAGYLLFGLVELAAAYAFISLAIDRGNILYYALTLIFLVGALQNLIKFIGTFINGSKARRAR